MHGQGNHRSSLAGRPTALSDEDDAVQLALLTKVLALHPTQLSLVELTRELSAMPEQFAERDRVEQALQDLTGAGLLHRNGSFVTPTRAALRFEELIDGCPDEH